jgi:polyferredoxin
MFGCNVETFRVAMDGSNVERDIAKASLRVALIALVIFVLLALVLGPWLWNNIFRRLVPGVGRSRWYDILLLAILFAIVVPA